MCGLSIFVRKDGKALTAVTSSKRARAKEASYRHDSSPMLCAVFNAELFLKMTIRERGIIAAPIRGVVRPP